MNNIYNTHNEKNERVMNNLVDIFIISDDDHFTRKKENDSFEKARSPPQGLKK